MAPKVAAVSSTAVSLNHRCPDIDPATPDPPYSAMTPPSPLATRTLNSLASALAAGQTTSRQLVETALEAIDVDRRAFTFVDTQSARAAADLSDSRRARSAHASSYDGIPISLKDLFDLKGQSTPAGSVVLRGAQPADADAPVAARLMSAGLIVVGRTHMSEFAFTGLGLNPHSDLLPNPRDPSRIPGGSSGGAAVSVALGQACAGIGTDTGGSIRIPAAFCGLVGFKPTQSRLTRQGTIPLSPSLDSIGPIAHSAACCEALDALMADLPSTRCGPLAPSALRFAAPRAKVVTDVDEAIGLAFGAALSKLSDAGVRIEEVDFPELDQIPRLISKGSLPNAEAFAWHRRTSFFGRPDLYDPNVLSRIQAGAGMSAADYIDLTLARADLIASAAARSQTFDAVIFPTTAIRAPTIEAVSTTAEFSRINALVLRNPSVVNFLDRCAITLPVTVDEGPPCGVTLMGERLGDARLLAIAQACEPIVR